MMQFVKKISFFKWNWSKKQKMTIEAKMSQGDLKKFIEHNGIKQNQDLNDVNKVLIVIEIKEK